MHRRHEAFTLVELLVVIGVIAVLLSILMPSLNKARDAAKAVACMSNERQIGLALLMYAGDNRGILPDAYDSATSPSWWPQKLAAAGYLPNPYGFRYADSAASAIWNCPAVVIPAGVQSNGIPHSHWTYVRAGNWATATDKGVAGYKKLSSIQNPVHQIMILDSSLKSADDIARGGAGSMSGALTRYYNVYINDTHGSGSPTYVHPGKTFNALFADGHVGSLTRRQVTESMFEDPDTNHRWGPIN